MVSSWKWPEFKKSSRSFISSFFFFYLNFLFQKGGKITFTEIIRYGETRSLLLGGFLCLFGYFPSLIFTGLYSTYIIALMLRKTFKAWTYQDSAKEWLKFVDICWFEWWCCFLDFWFIDVNPKILLMWWINLNNWRLKFIQFQIA